MIKERDRMEGLPVASFAEEVVDIAAGLVHIVVAVVVVVAAVALVVRLLATADQQYMW